MILREIVQRKHVEVEALRERTNWTQLEARARIAPPVRDFAAALRASPQPLALIAEVKRKSPSKGVFRRDLDVVRTVQAYRQAGAACLSVLTDEHFFMGSLDDLRAARTAVDLPVLRKDFVIDPLQIVEARAAGADAVLLIAAILSDAQLAECSALAKEWGMAPLLEVHDEHELERALSRNAKLVGINNRDLHTFQTDLATTERLSPRVPADCLIVAESGIHTRADVLRVQRAGARAMLVGESLIVAENIAQQVRLLLEDA